MAVSGHEMIWHSNKHRNVIHDLDWHPCSKDSQTEVGNPVCPYAWLPPIAERHYGISHGASSSRVDSSWREVIGHGLNLIFTVDNGCGWSDRWDKGHLRRWL